MKLALVSDLHIDAHKDLPVLSLSTDIDAVLIAGDIQEGPQTMEWARAQLKRFGVPVGVVLGNHEYYHAEMSALEHECRRALPAGLHLLQCSSFELDDYVILGCTLWTDFALLGDVRKAQAVAQKELLDYSAIRLGDRLLQPSDTAALHQQHRAWLKGELQRAFAEGMKAIVMTHHAPSPRSIPPHHASSPASAAFASDLSDWFYQPWAPVLWVHGHTHHPVDYQQGATRIVSHPRGYPSELPANAPAALGKLIELPGAGHGAARCDSASGEWRGREGNRPKVSHRVGQTSATER